MDTMIDKIDLTSLPTKVRNELFDFYINLLKKYANENIETKLKNNSELEKKINKFENILLNAPIWEENDVKAFEERIQEGYKNWKIKEF